MNVDARHRLELVPGELGDDVIAEIDVGGAVAARHLDHGSLGAGGNHAHAAP